MPRVRLVTLAEVEEWQAAVAAGLAKAQARQKAAMAPILKAHGLTWGSPARATSVDLWPKDAWANAVRLDLEPAVRAVAKKVVLRIRSRVSKKNALGFNPEDQLVAMVVNKALAIEPRLTIPASPAALTAASPAKSGTRFGGVTHPESNPTVLDEYQARFAELDRMTERITAHMSDAAQQVLAEGAVASAGVKYVWCAVGDERTRPSHLDANGQPQAAGDPFDVGDVTLMFPGDPSGPDEEVDNCRCWLEVDGVEVDGDYLDSIAEEAA